MILQAYISISRQFMNIVGEYIYIYIYIYVIHSYCKSLSLYLANSCIWQANIYISRQFMHIVGEYIYI